MGGAIVYMMSFAHGLVVDLEVDDVRREPRCIDVAVVSVVVNGLMDEPCSILGVMSQGTMASTSTNIKLTMPSTADQPEP
eukprot:873019-Amphidinium_carterae.1